MKTITFLGWGLALLAQGAWAADICEPLREQIEAQIAATGKSGFAVMVVDADADVAGKVVGTCAKGARKLVYVQSAATGAVTAASAKVAPRPAMAAQAAPRPRGPVVITECRDGSVVQGNATCKP